MKVIGRVNREDQELFSRLREGNIQARIVKNALIIDLPKLDKYIYGIPDILFNENVIYFIECIERGGREGGKESATIICDKSGNPMRPYYIPKTKSNTNGEHAYFAVPFCITVQISDNMPDVITISERSLIKEEDRIELVTRLLGKCEVNDIPKAFDRFENAIKIAFEKSRIVDCNKAMFILTKEMK